MYLLFIRICSLVLRFYKEGINQVLTTGFTEFSIERKKQKRFA